jgi:hypothetical protein
VTKDILDATYRMLGRQLGQFRAAIADIPDEDLNTWKPAAEAYGGGPMNTFATLAVHITAAGTWRIYQQVYGDEVKRDRESEFRATASADEIDRMFDGWLAGFRERIERENQPDLTSLPDTPREDHPEWTRLDWLLTMIDHNALHIGHVQIHRQLWLAERGNHPQ